MQKLVQISAVERQRILDEFTAHAFEGIPDDAPGAHIARAMRSIPTQLPDDPSDAQVDAWVELSMLVADPAFAARVREMAVAGAAGQPQQPIDIPAIREHAGKALAAGTAPSAPEAQSVIDRVLPQAMPRAERVELRERLALFNDVRVERYWQLMAVLNKRPPMPPVAADIDWFIAALHARE